MKKHIIVLGIIMSATVHAQTINFNHFDEDKMNEVLFSQMSDSTSKNCLYQLVQVGVGKEEIYRFIKRNNDKLSLDDLSKTINTNILRRYDSKAISQSDLTGKVGMICRIDCLDSKTYQKLAICCITEWYNSENLIFLQWSQIVEATTFYTRRTREVYVFWAYYN